MEFNPLMSPETGLKRFHGTAEGGARLYTGVIDSQGVRPGFSPSAASLSTH